MYHSTLNIVKGKKYSVIGVVSAHNVDDELLYLLDEKAKDLNADGIIGIKIFGGSTRSNGCPNLIAYGTAIKFED